MLLGFHDRVFPSLSPLYSHAARRMKNHLLQRPGLKGRRLGLMRALSFPSDRSGRVIDAAMALGTLSTCCTRMNSLPGRMPGLTRWRSSGKYPLWGSGISSVEEREIQSRGSIYVEMAGISDGAITDPFKSSAWRAERNHPAESQDRGTENSDQPQSRQMRTSGEGVKGGWLNVRGLFR